jgi:phosphoglycolate phosphatase-like HAD superfamily hydrolase
MANQSAISAVFFDLGATLVEPKCHPDGSLESLEPMDGAVDILQQMTKRGLTLGVISNTGPDKPAVIRKMLTEAKLSRFFPKKDLVVLSGDLPIDKSSPAIFRLAAARAGRSYEECLFVGDDPNERRMARLAGMRTARTAQAALAAIKSRKVEKPNLSGMIACISDSRLTVKDRTPGPRNIKDYKRLMRQLKVAKRSLPPVYQESCADPFLAELQKRGAWGFRRTVKADPKLEGEAGLMFDIAQSILQNRDGAKLADATDAFEEVASDLYDGFLSAEDRAGIKQPDHTVLAPLVKWGDPDSGPYTWPVDATEKTFDFEAAVVSLPPANAQRGLLGWTLLSHETAGHDILHADEHLEEEYAAKVLAALRQARIGQGLDEYWSQRIDETASDVMGILNMGPAAAIGMVVYFRGWNAADGNKPKLSNDGALDDMHPADILRGFVAASTVRMLSFAGAADWAKAIEDEVRKDLDQVKLGDFAISRDLAMRSCEIVASTLATARMPALNHHSLIEIQNWRDHDEDIVRELQANLLKDAPAGGSREDGIYAAHVVAAATMTVLAGKKDLKSTFKWMLKVLKKMHDSNPSWGSLYVAHPGDIARHFVHAPPKRRPK